MIAPRPYVLNNPIRRYAWGTRGRDAFLPRLLGFEAEDGVPYAELWMGAHASAPSMAVVDGESIPLNRWISEHPGDLLGERVAGRFSGKLPFLLKVLSAGRSLSIQAHPNREQAAGLHARDPEHYPDTNHKPEIAVALDDLTVLIGLKSRDAYRRVLEAYPEIAKSAGITEAVPVQDAFKDILGKSKAAPGDLASAIDGLKHRLRRAAPRDEEARLFLELVEAYGIEDVGLLAIFLMNVAHLKRGEGLYIDAGIPHAYLRGNVVECMANSDNVVRIGLTPKFKDVDALVEILDCEPGKIDTIEADPGCDEIVYGTPAEEFELVRWLLDADRVRTVKTHGSPQILLVVEGEVELTDDGGTEFRRMVLERGASVFLPARLDAYRMIASTSSEMFVARVPE